MITKDGKAKDGKIIDWDIRNQGWKNNQGYQQDQNNKFT
jgi:hypothetical protein